MNYQASKSAGGGDAAVLAEAPPWRRGAQLAREHARADERDDTAPKGRPGDAPTECRR